LSKIAQPTIGYDSVLLANRLPWPTSSNQSATKTQFFTIP